MASVAMMAPSYPETVVVNGRTYTGAAGTVLTVPDFDAPQLEANGWHPVTGSTAHATGTTAQRPANPKKWDKYADSTLGYIVLFDGKLWRHPLTGASV